MRTDLIGRDITDPEVRAAIRRSIREIPFHDLVEEIEGEEAAAAMEQDSANVADDTKTVVVSDSDNIPTTEFPPPSKRNG